MSIQIENPDFKLLSVRNLDCKVEEKCFTMYACCEGEMVAIVQDYVQAADQGATVRPYPDQCHTMFRVNIDGETLLAGERGGP